MKTDKTFVGYFNRMAEYRDKGDEHSIELMQSHYANELIYWNDLEPVVSQLADVVALQRAELQTEMNVKLSATVQILVEKGVISEDVAEQIIDTYSDIDKQLEEANSEQEDS